MQALMRYHQFVVSPCKTVSQKHEDMVRQKTVALYMISLHMFYTQLESFNLFCIYNLFGTIAIQVANNK